MVGGGGRGGVRGEEGVWSGVELGLRKVWLGARSWVEKGMITVSHIQSSVLQC